MAFTCADGWVPPCAPVVPAGPILDPAFYWLAGWAFVWVLIAVARYKRWPLRPGFYIGLVGLVALLAAVFPPDSIWLRAIAVFAGFSFLIGEVVVIYIEGNRRDNEARTMLSSVAQLSQALDAGEKAREELRRAVDYIVDAGYASLWRRTWEMVRSLSDLLRANFFTRWDAGNKAAAPSPQDAGGAYGGALDAMGRRLDAERQADLRTINSFLSLADDVKALVREYQGLELIDTNLTTLANRGIQEKVEDIAEIQKGLIGLANQLEARK
jgi:hypothetical protein